MFRVTRAGHADANPHHAKRQTKPTMESSFGKYLELRGKTKRGYLSNGRHCSIYPHRLRRRERVRSNASGYAYRGGTKQATGFSLKKKMIMR